MSRRPISEREKKVAERWGKRMASLGHPQSDEVGLYEALTTAGVFLYSPDQRDALACSLASHGIRPEDLELLRQRMASDRGLTDPVGFLASRLTGSALQVQELILDVEAAASRRDAGAAEALPDWDGSNNYMAEPQRSTEARTAYELHRAKCYALDVIQNRARGGGDE